MPTGQTGWQTNTAISLVLIHVPHLLFQQQTIYNCLTSLTRKQLTKIEIDRFGKTNDKNVKFSYK